MAQDLIGRVKRLLTSPKTEWEAIDRETVEPQGLITGYVAPLAAIPAIAGVIGLSVFGVASFKAPFGSALVSGAVSFVMAIVSVFVFAAIINALAPTFGAQKNFNQALKVAAYAPTAGWLAGVFVIIPMLGILTLVGALYSLYLIFVGLPKLMKPPAEKATTYTIVSIIVAIVAGLIIGVIANAVTPKPTYTTSSSAMQQHADALDKAAESGDMAAVFGALGGMAGVDANAPVVDRAALEKLAPARIAGLKRESLNSETMTAPFKAVTMKAAYGGGDRRVDLTVTNSPALTMMGGLAALAGETSYNRESDDGYERMRREDGAVIVEEWSKSAKRGRYGRTVLGTFLIEAEGRGVDMKDLEKAVKEFSENELKNLKKAA